MTRRRLPRSWALVWLAALGCASPTSAVTPTAPARGGDPVVATASPTAGPIARPWRDALRGDRQAIRIPDHTPARGATQPLVTIVHFGDYTHAPSAAAARVIDQALARWPDDVRLAFVHVPSPRRPLAHAAAQSAAASGAIDRFWQLHDRLFARPPTDMAGLEQAAVDVGLDANTWRQALADDLHRPWIDASIASARALGVARPGVVAVNGRIAPATPDGLAALIASERDAMAKLVGEGLPRSDVYTEILAVGDVPTALAGANNDGSVDPLTNYAVPAAGRPVLGPVDAPITIIVFSDFECPFCARVQGVLKDLRAKHPQDVRIVFRNMPLAFHPHARDLAMAALAADAHGKFWPMHDLIFAHAEKTADWRPLAKRLRLDPRKLAQTMKSPLIAQKLAEDLADAAAFGVAGTPTFFINGRMFGGAQSVEDFERVIAEELPKAREFAANDLGGEGTFYDRMIDGFAPPPVPPDKRR